MKKVLVLTNKNLSTSEKSAENINCLQEITWVIPRGLSCTSLWVDKGPEDAELRGSETAAGGSEQSLIWTHLFYIIWPVQSLTQASFSEQFASPGIVRCRTWLYHTSICSIVPNMSTKDNLNRLKRKKVLWGKNQTNKKGLQSPIPSNQKISGPDYTDEMLQLIFYMNKVVVGKSEKPS